MTPLLAAAGQPFDLVRQDGQVMVHGVVGGWCCVEKGGVAVTACVDLPDGSLFLVEVTPEVMRSAMAVPVVGVNDQ